MLYEVISTVILCQIFYVLWFLKAFNQSFVQNLFCYCEIVKLFKIWNIMCYFEALNNLLVYFFMIIASSTSFYDMGQQIS